MRTSDRHPIPELSTVTLRHPHKCDDKVLPEGGRGTIVYAYRGGEAYEVEFEEPFHCVTTVQRDEIQQV
jgi:hypothetical protein